MSLKIISQKENTLMARKEISAQVDFSGPTPKKDDIKKMIASHISSEESLVVIKVIKNNFGAQSAKVEAYVYSSADTFKKIEEYRKQAKKPAEGAEASAPAKKK
jgi:ribosomal protein S24E